jgi:hypothetical protein
LRTLARRLHWSLHRTETSTAGLQRNYEQLRKTLDELRLERTANGDPAAHLIGSIIQKLGGPGFGDEIGDWRHRVSVDEVVTALRDLGELRHRRDSLTRDLETIGRELNGAQNIIATAIKEYKKAITK